MTPQELAEIVAAVRSDLEATPLAATLGHLVVNPGDVILADHINSLADQAIPKFASATARDAAWPATVAPIGAMCYLTDVNTLQVCDDQITGGTKVWHPAGGLRMGFARMGEGQTIPVNTDTLVGLTSAGGAANKPGRAVWNSDGSVTVPYTGTYLVTGTVAWPAYSGGERWAFVMLNPGSGWQLESTSGGVQWAVAAASPVYQQVSAQVYAGAGHKIGMLASHTAAIPLTLPTLSGNPASPRLAIHLLGAD